MVCTPHAYRITGMALGYSPAPAGGKGYGMSPGYSQARQGYMLNTGSTLTAYDPLKDSYSNAERQLPAVSYNSLASTVSSELPYSGSRQKAGDAGLMRRIGQDAVMAQEKYTGSSAKGLPEYAGTALSGYSPAEYIPAASGADGSMKRIAVPQPVGAIEETDDAQEAEGADKKIRPVNIQIRLESGIESYIVRGGMIDARNGEGEDEKDQEENQRGFQPEPAWNKDYALPPEQAGEQAYVMTVPSSDAYKRQVPGGIEQGSKVIEEGWNGTGGAAGEMDMNRGAIDEEKDAYDTVIMYNNNNNKDGRNDKDSRPTTSAVQGSQGSEKARMMREELEELIGMETGHIASGNDPGHPLSTHDEGTIPPRQIIQKLDGSTTHH
ncbi:MAG: hypothetical protein R6U32_01615 [Candidatus Woesearchaeota archaeon]